MSGEEVEAPITVGRTRTILKIRGEGEGGRLRAAGRDRSGSSLDRPVVVFVLFFDYQVLGHMTNK